MPIYTGTSAGDDISGGASDDTINGLGGNDHLRGFGGNDLIDAAGGNDELEGGDGNDTLYGGAGDDHFLITSGADTISGGAGTDTVNFNYRLSATGLTLDLANLWTGGTGFVNGASITGVETLEGLIGSAFDDVITTGDFATKTLFSVVGPIYGVVLGNGNDIASGGKYEDYFQGEQGDDTLYGGGGNDILVGDGNVQGRDAIYGGDGDDAIEADGRDIVDGGAGYDTLEISFAASASPLDIDLTPLWTGGMVTIGEAALSGVERITDFKATSGSDRITVGDAVTSPDGWAVALDLLEGDDTVFGGAAGESMLGGSGNDMLYGGDGDDALAARYGGNGSRFDLAEYDQLFGGAGNDALNTNGSRGEAYGGAGDDTLWGATGSDLFYGGDGNDVIEIRGEDFAYGGTGTDTVSFYFSNATSGVSIDLTNLWTGGEGLIGNGRISGVETIRQFGTSNYDDVVITGDYATADIEYFVNTGVYLLGGNDIARGGIYADRFDGGSGYDYLYGGAGNDLLYGNVGGDTLEGGAGNDQLYGGDGIDAASYASAASRVSVNLALTTAQNTLGAGSDTLAGIEELIGSAFDDVLTGDAGNNTLYGGAGADVLSGGAGANSLYGGDGDDTLSGGVGNDLFDGGAGTDLVSYASATAAVTVSLLLGSQNTGGSGTDMLTGIEALVGSNYNDTLVGDAGGNSLSGGNGNDMLTGGLGVDMLYGGAGNDGFAINAAAELVVGERYDGGAGNDTLYLNYSANTDLSSMDLVGIEAVRRGYPDDYDTALTAAQLDGLSDLVGQSFTLTTGGSVSMNGATIAGVEWFNLSSAGNIFDLTGAAVLGGVDVYGAAGVDIITGSSGNDTLYGGEGKDTLDGGDGDDSLYGGAGIDIIRGGAGDDYISVFDAADMLGGEQYDGGIGTDYLSLDFAGSIDLSGAHLVGIEGIDHAQYIGGVIYRYSVSLTATQLDGLSYLSSASVRLTTGGTVSMSGANIADAGIFFLSTAGNTLDLTGTAGGVGAVVYGAAGVDMVTGSAEWDMLYGDGGNDRLDGGAGDDNLYGGDGKDTIGGGAGTDEIHGGAGADILVGGAGDDLIYIDAAGDVAAGERYDGGAGTDSLFLTFAGDVDLSATSLVGIEAVMWMEPGGDSGDHDVRLTAAQLMGLREIYADSLTLTTGGAISLATVHAGVGVFNLSSAGTIFDLSSTSDGAVVQGGAGADVVTGSGGSDSLSGNGANDTITGAAGDDYLFGGAGNDSLTGGAGDDYLEAGDGNDILIGGLGNDFLEGGSGVVTASYAGAGGAVSVDLAAGTSAGADGVDDLRFIDNVIGSGFNDLLTGGDGANVLTGVNGNDTLTGGLGNDTLDGGAGSDTASYADAAIGVTISLANHSVQNTVGAGSDLLVGIENVTGSAYADTLTGNEFANVLSGGGGNDSLDGGLGNDTLIGGDGVDTANYGRATGAIRANLTIVTAQSTISAGSDTLAGIENLMGGAYDDQLTGDAGNNVLTGNAGNDLLVGGLGDDTLSGGAGIDTASYANATAGVTISLLLTTAQNTGGAGLDSFVSIENLTGSAYDDVITGSAQVNVINGGNGNDMIDAGSSNDSVDGGYGNDILKGAAGDDILIGNVGTDTLTGGAGADTLTGGTQNDRFVYAALTDSTLAASDRIVDFAKGDILDMSAIDASSKSAGNQGFVQAAAFTHVAGQFTLAYDAGTNTTTALFDTDGDAAANMVILFTGDVTAMTGSWIL